MSIRKDTTPSPRENHGRYNVDAALWIGPTSRKWRLLDEWDESNAQIILMTIRKLVSLVYNAQRQHFCAKIIGRSVVGGPMQE